MRRQYKNRHCFCKLPLAVGKSLKRKTGKPAERLRKIVRKLKSVACAAWEASRCQSLMLHVAGAAVALCGGRRRHWQLAR